MRSLSRRSGAIIFAFVAVFVCSALIRAQSSASIQREVTEQNYSRSASSLVMMIMRRSVFYSLVRIGLVSIAGLITTYGQIPIATINGLVTDQTGAVIVGAEITVKQMGTGFLRKLTTRDDGRFRVENLQPGEYQVEVNNQGFSTVWR